jgi:hypothetical protein
MAAEFDLRRRACSMLFWAVLEIFHGELRMRGRWGAVVAAIVFAACMGACGRKADPGYAELQQSREATRAATSWQDDVTVQLPSGPPVIVELSKVECPGRMDVLAILREPRNGSVHEIWYDGTYYNKSEAVGQWLSHPASANPFPNCGQGPGLMWDGVLYDDLDAAHATGEIRRGKPGFFENASCIWWEVAPAKGAPPHYSVCVGEADHLPRVVRSREHNLNYVYTLTKWNVTAVVLPAEAKIVAN